jgi:hypothetical protein
MTLLLSAFRRVLQSRRGVNVSYFFLPPLGLLLMLMSPVFSRRERVSRAFLMASVMAFFALMGPQLHQILTAQAGLLASR